MNTNTSINNPDTGFNILLKRMIHLLKAFLILIILSMVFTACTSISEKNQYPLIKIPPEKKTFSLDRNHLFHKTNVSTINFGEQPTEKNPLLIPDRMDAVADRKMVQIPYVAVTESLYRRKIPILSKVQLNEIQGFRITEKCELSNQNPVNRQPWNLASRQPNFFTITTQVSVNQSPVSKKNAINLLPYYLSLLVPGVTCLGCLVAITNYCNSLPVSNKAFRHHKRRHINSMRSEFSKFSLGMLFLGLILFAIIIIIIIIEIMAGNFITLG